MTPTGFEQFAVGQVFTSPPRTLNATEIKTFAQEYDFQPQHVSEEAAVGTMFGSLAASGWHTAAVTMRMMLESVIGGVSGRGLGIKISDITWAVPVRPGDELHAVSEVLELRPSKSKPDRGIAVIRTKTVNQHGQTVQDMTGTLLILRSDAVIEPPHSAA